MLGRWVSLGAAALALALPAGAQAAASITYSGDVLTFTSPGSIANNVSFILGTQDFECPVRDTAPCLTVQEAGDDTITGIPARCVADPGGFNSVECDAPTSIVVNAGGGDDSVFDWEGPSVINGEGGNEITLEGRGGNDVINGGPGNDALMGGEGTDTLDGGDGNDFFEGFGGLSPTEPTNTNGPGDVYIGGTGKDFVDYAGRTEPLTISLDGAANDGAAGESDNVGADVEEVRGGNDIDALIGNDLTNWLDGWDGNDTVTGAGGDDSLFGRAGDDNVSGGDGQDTIEGGDGNDAVDGGAGIDTLWGDELQVCIPSVCASGQDTITARDGVADNVQCGPGQDSAVLDSADRIPDAAHQDACEGVDRSSAPTGGGDGGGAGGGGTGGGTADVLAPQLGGIKAGKLRRGRAINIRYTLSEAARVTFKFQKRRKGRWVKIKGSIVHSGKAGSNSLRFKGKVKGRRLKLGTYRISAVARDAAGNRGPARRATLRVVR